MKLDIIGGNLFKQLDGFVAALISLFGKGNQKFGITRFGQQLFPFRFGKLFETLRLIRFTHQLRIPGRHQGVETGRDPIGTFEMIRKTRRLPPVAFQAPNLAHEAA